MKNVYLKRFIEGPDGVFGRLAVEGTDFESFTVECPWENNTTFISCVPEGSYKMILGTYFAGGYAAWELVDVPGRSLIKIHRANKASEICGCIAPGEAMSESGGVRCVSFSKVAHLRFMAAMEPDTDAMIHISCEGIGPHSVAEIPKTGGDND